MMRKASVAAIIIMAMMFVCTTCYAANDVTGNPRFIDTFGSNVTITTKPIWISSVIVEGASLADTATFVDSDGTVVLRLSNTVNAASIIWTPAEPFLFNNGLIFDDSASDLASGDFILIYGR